MNGLYIIWPEKRFVPAETIYSWFCDAVHDQEIAEEYLLTSKDDVLQQGMALEDAGWITLGNQKEIP